MKIQSEQIQNAFSLEGIASQPQNKQEMLLKSENTSLYYDPFFFPFDHTYYSQMSTLVHWNQASKMPFYQHPYHTGPFYEPTHYATYHQSFLNYKPQKQLEPQQITNYIPLPLQQVKVEAQKIKLEQNCKKIMLKTCQQISRNSKKHTPNYYWSNQENRRYCQFLQGHQHIFSLSINEKKDLRINVMMSKRVKSRTPQQCHSHHQKMIKKFGSIPDILRQMTEIRNQKKQIKKRDQVKLNKDQVKKEQFDKQS